MYFCSLRSYFYKSSLIDEASVDLLEKYLQIHAQVVNAEVEAGAEVGTKGKEVSE